MPALLPPAIYDRACAACGFCNRRDARFCGDCGRPYSVASAPGQLQAAKYGMFVLLGAGALGLGAKWLEFRNAGRTRHAAALNEARRLESTGNWPEAITTYKQILEERPDDKEIAASLAEDEKKMAVEAARLTSTAKELLVNNDCDKAWLAIEKAAAFGAGQEAVAALEAQVLACERRKEEVPRPEPLVIRPEDKPGTPAPGKAEAQGKDYGVRGRFFEEQRRACDGGDGYGCAALGQMYGAGDGVGKDESKAFEFVGKACDLGSGTGCYYLGAAYHFGVGVTGNVGKAIGPYRKACELKTPNGCFNLGTLYLGAPGVEADYAKAARFLRSACDGRHPDGCANLGSMYANGSGLPANKAEALKLFRKACGLGSESGCAWADSAGKP